MSEQISDEAIKYRITRPIDRLRRELMTISEMAVQSGMSRTTLWRWRRGGIGPPAIQAGRTVVYPRKGFEDWLSGKD